MPSKFLTAAWNANVQVKTIITTRLGNDKHPLGFNLATHVGDDLDVVIQNRLLLVKQLEKSPHWLHQTHSNNVLNLDSVATRSDVSTGSNYDPIFEYDNYDAAITHRKNIVCAIMTADCIPILLTDIDASFVASIHAGRMGLANNIIFNTVTMSNAIKSKILAFIGPAICKNHYEVGYEIFEQFVRLDKNNQEFFLAKSKSIAQDKSALLNEKFNCDLSGIAKMQLIKCGLDIRHIFQSDLCTYCRNDLFYSYRREKKTGRFASLIWLS